MSVSFAGHILSNASTFDDDAGIQIKEDILLSGKNYVSASTETTFKPSFSCYTETLLEITALRGHIGISGTLVIGSDSYINCYIKSFKSKLYAPGKWSYQISFTQHTA
jgi:hypothetical protein